MSLFSTLFDLDLKELIRFRFGVHHAFSILGSDSFDPLYLSNVFDIKWLREAELKHGRVCMLATLGFIVQEFVHLPGPMFQNKLATTAHWSVPQEGMLQIFLFCGLIEFITHKGKLTYENMHSAGEEPGNFGFDPLGLGKNPATLAKYKANEILNGRLAMIAIGGFIHQMWITKQPIVEQLQNFKPLM